MTEPWTEEKEIQLKKLRREKAKVIRDQKRQRAYSPRLPPVGSCEFKAICYNYQSEGFRQASASLICENLPWHGACSLEVEYTQKKNAQLNSNARR
jgi:hypothetical protein